MDLYDTANKLLSLIITQLEDNGVIVPARQYVAPGLDIAFDCEQLTIHLARIISNFQGSDTPYPVQTHSILRKSAEYFITLVRCVPSMNDDGTPPSVDALSTAASVVMQDMMYLRRALEDIEHQHLLVPRNIPVSIGQAATIGPLGGMTASQISYTVELTNTATGWV